MMNIHKISSLLLSLMLKLIQNARTAIKLDSPENTRNVSFTEILIEYIASNRQRREYKTPKAELLIKLDYAEDRDNVITFC